MRDARRYWLVSTNDGADFLIGAASVAILKALKSGSQFSYKELSEKVGIPINSLYVFCERLEKARIIKRKKETGGFPVRVRTIILAKKAYSIKKMKVLK